MGGSLAESHGQISTAALGYRSFITGGQQRSYFDPVSGLVNGGSKPVSPCTSVPSPAPNTVNVSSPASVPSAEASTVVAPITKVAKKSKSTSPDSGSTPAASASLVQRPKLKSTAELVAEMTSSYPETMSIKVKNVVPTPASPPLGASVTRGGRTVMASVLAAADSDPSDVDDSKDVDYVDRNETKYKTKDMWRIVNDERDGSDFRNVNKADMLARYLRDHSTGTGDGRRQRREKVKDKDKEPEVAVPIRAPVVHAPIDWYSAVQLPPIDFSVLEPLVDDEEGELEGEAGGSGRDVCDKKTVDGDSETDEGKFLDSCVCADEEEATSSKDEQKADGAQWRSRLLKTTKRGDRQVLAMPYVDIGLPDFIEYGYSNREQYLAHWSER